MKKSLIALALMGAFSGAAFAQSNVTLYGILDVNVQRNDPKEGTCFSNFANGTQTSCSTTTGLNGGHQSGNRWGVRGSEALGGGMNAIFTLEGGFDIDTAQLGNGGRLFGRQAWAGLEFSNAKISLVGGRMATFSSGTGAFDLFGFVDPFLTGFGDSGMQNTFTSAGAQRADNTVAIVGGPWAGFKAGAAYSFNVIGTENPGSSNNNRGIFTGLQYAWGPLMVAFTYDIIQPANPALDDEKHMQIGGTWDFKIAKLHAGFAKEDNVYFNTVGSTATLNAIDPGADADAWIVGVTVPLFGGSFLASYQDRDGDPIAISPGVTRERDLSVWAIGYTYPLSRRTNMYVNFSSKDAEKDANGVANIDRNQATLGVRHLF